MIVGFVAALLLIGFVYGVILAIISIPLSALATITMRQTKGHNNRRSAMLTHALLGVIYAGLIGVTVSLMLSRGAVETKWLYVLTGFVVVFGFLSSNLQEKVQEANYSFSQTSKGIAEGALIGLVLGTASYLVFYTFPELLLVVPGAPTLFEWTMTATRWILQFTLVQIAIMVMAVFWIFGMGMKLLTYGAIATAAAVSAIKGGRR